MAVRIAQERAHPVAEFDNSGRKDLRRERCEEPAQHSRVSDFESNLRRGNIVRRHRRPLCAAAITQKLDVGWSADSVQPGNLDLRVRNSIEARLLRPGVQRIRGPVEPELAIEGETSVSVGYYDGRVIEAETRE